MTTLYNTEEGPDLMDRKILYYIDEHRTRGGNVPREVIYSQWLVQKHVYDQISAFWMIEENK